MRHNCPTCVCGPNGDVVLIPIHRSLLEQMKHEDWSPPVQVMIEKVHGHWELTARTVATSE